MKYKLIPLYSAKKSNLLEFQVMVAMATLRTCVSDGASNFSARNQTFWGDLATEVSLTQISKPYRKKVV